jgi:ankyrin repeat protein
MAYQLIFLFMEDSAGDTPLHLAIGKEEVAFALLDKNANLQIRNEDGQTALIKAAFQGSRNIVEVKIIY